MSYTADKVADMTMNDEIGGMESGDSLDEESSSSSSNDEPSSQSEVESSSNTDSEFHGRQILIERRSVRNRPLKRAKTKGSQTMVELSQQEEAFQTMREEP